MMRYVSRLCSTAPAIKNRLPQQFMQQTVNPLMKQHIKRFFDLAAVLTAAVLLFVPMAMIAVLIKLTSRGPVLYWSNRVGQHNQLFSMPKFRTMQVETPTVATHLLTNPNQYLTPIGPFLRRSSLDELPQLWSIWVGDMSWVGPRPALFNQDDLIKLRTQAGVDLIKPGLTGWAQVNGRDELPISQKVAFDAEYLKKQSLRFDIYVIWLTAIQVFRREGIAH
jgi:O-antigen biosynthesis protein WbqP